VLGNLSAACCTTKREVGWWSKNWESYAGQRAQPRRCKWRWWGRKKRKEF